MLVELAGKREPERRWSFDRDIEIRRHVGDYALFSSGLFRAWVERQGLANLFCRTGAGSIRGGGGHGAAELRRRSATPAGAGGGL